MVDTKLIAKEGNTLYVAAPNPFAAEMIEQRMYSLIALAAQQVLKNEDIEIEIVVVEAEESPSGAVQTSEL